MEGTIFTGAIMDKVTVYKDCAADLFKLLDEEQKKVVTIIE